MITLSGVSEYSYEICQLYMLQFSRNTTHSHTDTHICMHYFILCIQINRDTERGTCINKPPFFSEILKQSQRINPFFCDTFLACLKNEQFFVLSLIFYNTHLLIKQDVGPFESFCCFGLGSPRKTPKESTPLIVLGPQNN